MSTAAANRLTAEEFARLPNPPDGSKQELVRGKIVTLPPNGFLHGFVQGNVASLLKAHVRQHKLGRVTVESGVITEQGPDTVRGPDVAFWSYQRVPQGDVPVVYANEPADLVTEVVSPGNTKQRMTLKVRKYFNSGVRLVWVVHPEERTVIVYTKPGDGTVLWEDATLTGGDVLPGFRCPVAEFFQD
ncbi:Uma2 family endonuclease [bacterium]|nr:Uma2 family endonuclease [bacterium]